MEHRNIRDWIKNDYLVFDGAMGTMLQEKGLPTGQIPEVLNFTNTAMLVEIHKAYIDAGCHVITTNTFGASAYKLQETTYTPEQVIFKAVENARAANPAFVALDIGPIGQMLQPTGSLSFEDAYNMFRQQVSAGVQAGVDCIIVETLSDLYEAKAAVLAAKECCDLPLFCSFSFQEDGRTFMGTDPATVVLTLQGLGIDAIGVNCSLGPESLHPIVDVYLQYAKIPVLVQANAGLPKEEKGKTVFDVGPEDYGASIEKMIAKGVRIVGGCCGTTPAHIQVLRKITEGKAIVPTTPETVTAATSPLQTVILDHKLTVIGERINPTGKKKLKAALAAQDMDYLVSEAIGQTSAGSDILDVNVGLPEIDEIATMRKAVQEIQAVCSLPLQIDSADPKAIEAGVRIYNGKPIINSVSGKQKIMDAVFPIVKKYGAVIIGLALDDDGIPDSAEKRLAIAKKIMETALSYGIPKEDIIIDTLTLTASAQQDQAMESLRAITLIKDQLGLKCSLGVSNVSFGLPSRPLLNSTFLAMAAGAGLDVAIINPLSQPMMDTVRALQVLIAQDQGAQNYIEKQSATPATETVTTNITAKSLREMIIEGRKGEAPGKVTQMLETEKPLQIIDNEIIPALDYMGRQFEKGAIFLPQLMQSAETVKQAFEVIKDFYLKTGHKQDYKGTILLATVKGDIHDIGKNIVKLLLENYGYNVIDLGKDVDIAQIVETVSKENIPLVGLSALMTTTVKNMEETISALRSANLPCTVFVGGAVLTEEYAKMVGANYYAKDARDGVKFAQEFFGNA